MPIQLTEHEEVELGLHGAFTLYASIFGTERYSASYQKRNVNTNSATMLYSLQNVLMVAQSLWD